MADKKYCIFCKIVEGEIHAHKVYEDKDFLAFLDNRPLNPGHTLVIPKKHYKWVWDVPNIGKYFEVVQKIAEAIKKTSGTEKVVSIIFGETIQHAHVWLVPKLDNDGHPFGWLDIKNVKNISDKEMEDIAKKISNAIE